MDKARKLSILEQAIAIDKNTPACFEEALEDLVLANAMRYMLPNWRNIRFEYTLDTEEDKWYKSIEDILAADDGSMFDCKIGVTVYIGTKRSHSNKLLIADSERILDNIVQSACDKCYHDSTKKIEDEIRVKIQPEDIEDTLTRLINYKLGDDYLFEMEEFAMIKVDQQGNIVSFNVD